MDDRKINPPIDDALVRRWLIVFLVAGVIWRLVRFAVAFPVWGDEAMLGLNVVDRSYRELLQPLQYYQVAPLGYLWLLRFVFDWLGISDYTARLPALLAGLTALVLFWHWARLLVSQEAAALAVGIVAVSGYLVRYSVELKPYATDFLTGLLLLFFGARYLASARRRWLVALVVAAPFCAAISYPQIFVAAAVGIAVLLQSVRRDWKHVGLALLFGLVAATSFVAFLAICARGQYQATADGMVPFWRHGFPPANPFLFIHWLIKIHTGEMFAYPVGGRSGSSIVTTLLFSLGIVALWRKWNIPMRLMLFLPFLFTFAAAVARLYPYGTSLRISQHLAPVIILGAAAGAGVAIDRLRREHVSRLAFNMIGGLLLVIGCIRLAGNVVWPYRIKADAVMRTTARQLIATGGSDPIFILKSANVGMPTLFWYFRERSRSFMHEMAPSPELLKGRLSAWTITWTPPGGELGADLAHAAGMRSTVWRREDLQVGRRDEPPLRLEILHLDR